jgi:hypothetical protein
MMCPQRQRQKQSKWKRKRGGNKHRIKKEENKGLISKVSEGDGWRPRWCWMDLDILVLSR